VGNAGVDHAAHNLNRADLRRTAVDEVSDKDSLSMRVTPRAGHVAIAERAQQRLQLVCVPVDVADDVAGRVRQPSEAPWRRTRGRRAFVLFGFPVDSTENALT
jgi:hypothetical protein